MSLLHPLLLWGLAAVAVPILIHLLLRQRPRPVPWAAMRWLLAAHRDASRRWRLTNWLLLALRCLVVALLALAVARPAIPGLGGGDHLVVVIDRSASMGARGADAGPLAAAQAALAQSELSYARWSVVAVGGAGPSELVASGGREAAVEALSRLTALPLPGGLDDTAPAVLTAALDPGCDVLLVSDFQQDDGGRALAMAAPRARRAVRWAVGVPAPNRWIAAAPEAGDLRPGEGGELRLRLGGAPGPVRIGVGGAPPVRVAERAGGELRVPLPPLPAGTHRLRVELDDAGLAYDAAIEVPLAVRPPLAALVVADGGDYAGAALLADAGGLAAVRLSPGAFAGAPLPPGGLVLLRGPVADAQRLAAWVRGGGVLWGGLDLLRADPALAALVAGVEPQPGTVPGGAYAAGEPDLDEVLGAARLDAARAVQLPQGARTLLTAGADPVAAALPAGRGWVVVELSDLAADRALAGRGTTPLWVVRTARRLAARADAPLAFIAGAPAPEALRLQRDGNQVEVVAGAPLILAPGTWQAGTQAVVVLPSPDEARTDAPPPAGIGTALSEVLPVRAGLDLGWWLLLAALAVAAIELLVAAAAGRRYGHGA